MGDNGWYAFDLDGTLALYDHWRGIEHIGEPIAPMVEHLKGMLAEGHDCRIFTARVYDDGTRDVGSVVEVINAWCLKHVGRVLPVTNVKDFSMVSLYDDRCIQVVPNTGVTVVSQREAYWSAMEDQAEEIVRLQQEVSELRQDCYHEV